MNRRELVLATSAAFVTGAVPVKVLAATSDAELKGKGMIIVTFEVEFEDDQIQT